MVGAAPGTAEAVATGPVGSPENPATLSNTDSQGNCRMSESVVLEEAEPDAVDAGAVFRRFPSSFALTGASGRSNRNAAKGMGQQRE